MSNELKSPLYPTPAGYECETVYGLFQTCVKWKEKAKRELERWLSEQREPEAA